MIYVGENKSILCKGDFHPAALYKGDKKIAGYITEEFSGEGGITLENCYNDKLHNAVIYGNSVQDGTPTPEAPIEVQSVGELVTEGEYAGKYKVPVTVRGKNLFDKDNAKLLSVAGGTTCKRTETGISHTLTSTQSLSYSYWDLGLAKDYGGKTIHAYVDLQQVGAERYTWSKFIIFDEANNKRTEIGYYTISGNKFHLYATIGTGYTEERLAIRLYAHDVSYPKGTTFYFNNIMVYTGESDSTYEPYIEPQTHNIYLDEPLCKIGDFTDYIDFEKGVIVRNIEKKVFDGTENWGLDVSTKNNSLYYFQRASRYLSNASSNKVCALSNRIGGLTWDGLWQNYYKESGATNLIVGVAIVYNSNDGAGNIIRYIKINPYSTLISPEEWKAQLVTWYEEGNPFTVWYAIPTEEKAIELPKLPTFKGTTIYEIDTGITAKISGEYKKTEEQL